MLVAVTVAKEYAWVALGATAVLAITLDTIVLTLFRALMDFDWSLTKDSIARCGWITVLRNSSPVIAVLLGITIGNISLNVPVLTLIVVCGWLAGGIFVDTPAVHALVTIVINDWARAVDPDSAVKVVSII